MPNISKAAKDTLDSLYEECGNDIFMLTEEYYGQGICKSCGALRDCVEPDATDYECEECGENAVDSIEIMIMQT